MVTPAEELREAAKLMRKRAGAATPGPWERPLDTRYRNFVMAAMPDDETGSWNDGIIPAEFASHKGPTGRYAGQRERVSVVSAAIWSIGGFVRKRSGRDLEHIASWHPLVALAVADWLEKRGKSAEAFLVPVEDSPSGDWRCEGCGDYVGEPGDDRMDACHCWDDARTVARAFLGTGEQS